MARFFLEEMEVLPKRLGVEPLELTIRNTL
jgi:hypothetical protein